jgi:flagellar motility protein MotE (MotC chaperone)
MGLLAVMVVALLLLLLDQVNVLELSSMGKRMPKVLPTWVPAAGDEGEDFGLPESSDGVSPEQAATERLDEQESTTDDESAEEPEGTDEDAGDGETDQEADAEEPAQASGAPTSEPAVAAEPDADEAAATEPTTEEAADDGEAAEETEVSLPAIPEVASEPLTESEAAERASKVRSMGDILSSMKPDEAASTLDQMPEERQVEVLRIMDEDDIAKILAEMEAEDRGRLALALLQ